MVQTLLYQLENMNNPPCSTFDNTISVEDYEIWKRDFTWEALHGIRYGQSFCNRFGITDNHLYYNDYNSGGVEWADEYIRKTYLSK
jgi:hypothetical protein